MEKNNYWKRNQDKFGSRNHLLFLWTCLSRCYEQDDVDGCNTYIKALEHYLPFESENEHQNWVDISSSFTCWDDFESITKTIIDRLTQKEKDELIFAYEKVAKDLCYCCDFKRVFDVFAKLSKWVYKMEDFDKFWSNICLDEYELQVFLENYKETYGDYLNIKELKESNIFYGVEDTPSCMFFQDTLEGKSDLMECIFERYAMGLDDEECLEFFKALIKGLMKQEKRL